MSEPRYPYDVPPFSDPKFHANRDRYSRAEWFCAICGRPVDETKKSTKWATVINGGADWGDENSPQDAGHMGSFPIGPDCHRKHRMTQLQEWER